MIGKKIYLYLFLCLCMFMFFTKVDAKTLQDYKNELSVLESNYQANRNKKALTDAEIKTVNSEINSIVSNINATKEEIKAAEADIISSREKIEEKRLETNELLKFLQVTTGENVYLEYLFEAESYTDFIYRFSVISQLSEYNSDLMTELKELINTLETKQEELAVKQTELEKQSNELNSKLTSLRQLSSSYEEDGSTIEEDIRDYKKEIAYYEDLGCGLNQDINDCIAVQYSTGFRYPISYGTVSSEYVGYGYRADYSGGSGHHGIDLWYYGIHGAPIYPTANGTIARYGVISGGGNAIYVYHNVNGVAYTSVYMHLSGFGNIYIGKKVTTNDVIGYVGNTGEYTTGAHLHFGLAYGHCANNFNANSFNPRNVLWFPGIYSGYFYR